MIVDFSQWILPNQSTDPDFLISVNGIDDDSPDVRNLLKRSKAN